MLPDATIIQIIIQGGAVGLMACLFFFLYRFGLKALTLGENLLANHLDHMTASLDEMSDNVTRLMDRIDWYLTAEKAKFTDPSSDESLSTEPSETGFDSDDPPG